MTALGINLGFFLFQVFNFTIVAIILYALAYKPIGNLLENRKKKIAQSLEDARIAAEARANAEVEAEKIINEARTQAAKVVSEASDRAEKAGRDIIAYAEAEAEKKRQDAEADAISERDHVLAEARGQIAALAIAATQKLVGDALDEKRQHALIQEFFTGVTSGKVVVLGDVGLSGSSAEITSALPLTSSEQDIVKSDILTKLGNQQATVTFRVDPLILGGLVVRVGDKVLDGSVSGQLDNLRQSLH
jgi:F-type H+-transporting ATPase subunit b